MDKEGWREAVMVFINPFTTPYNNNNNRFTGKILRDLYTGGDRMVWMEGGQDGGEEQEERIRGGMNHHHYHSPSPSS